MMALQSWIRPRIACCSFVAIAVFASGNVFAQSDLPTDSALSSVPTSGTPEASIQDWPKAVQTQARILIERYGEPSKFDNKELVWYNNGPWKTTILHREGFTHSATGADRDHLEQVIAYAVPADKVPELRSFDKRIEAKPVAGTLSSRADSESMNYLALNLADEIVTGKRTALGARGFYTKVKLLETSGKSSPYLDGLRFNTKDRNAPNP